MNDCIKMIGYKVHLQTFLSIAITKKRRILSCDTLVTNEQYMINFFFVCRNSPPIGPVPPHSRGFSITHDDAPRSVGLLWTSDQLVAETST